MLHRLSLQPELNELFLSLHKSSAQRRIRHAQCAGLIEKYGRSEALLRDFYNLLVITRRRHHLPPQPYDWLRNLNDCLGDAFALRLAYQGKTPVAGVLTLRFKDVVVYKYGCSDAGYHHLGAIPLLLWRTIEDAKSSGAREFDIGRSDEDDSGLITFKNRWAREATSIVDWRLPSRVFLTSRKGWRLRTAKRVFACMPNALLIATGRLLYRHIG
jgi:lipid II:glycine glycyltransferase (peptidoglycan interpeptide bridge formation enzyme)